MRDCIETIPKSPQPPIMGEPEGGRSVSFIPFMLPHYWGLGGAARLFIQFLRVQPMLLLYSQKVVL